MLKTVKIVFDLFNWFYSLFLNRLSLILFILSKQVVIFFFFGIEKTKKLVWKIWADPTQLTRLKNTCVDPWPDWPVYLIDWPDPPVLPRLSKGGELVFKSHTHTHYIIQIKIKRHQFFFFFWETKNTNWFWVLTKLISHISYSVARDFTGANQKPL